MKQLFYCMSRAQIREWTVKTKRIPSIIYLVICKISFISNTPQTPWLQQRCKLCIIVRSLPETVKMKWNNFSQSSKSFISFGWHSHEHNDMVQLNEHIVAISLRLIVWLSLVFQLYLEFVLSLNLSRKITSFDSDSWNENWQLFRKFTLPKKNPRGNKIDLWEKA